MDNYLREERMGKTLLFLLTLLLSINAFPVNFKKILEIGDDSKEKYTFFSIGDITTDSNGNIYVFDSKGYVLRKYDKNGRFVKQTGRRGQGPGDFSFSSSLSFSNNKLYVYDSNNRRIGIYDTELNLLKYMKLDKAFPSVCKSFETYGNYFYFSILLENQNGKIVITDKKTRIIKRFFKKYPGYLKDVLNTKDIRRKVFLDLYSSVILSLNKNKKEIAVMFSYPEHNMKVFIYDLKGKFKKEYDTNILKGYKVPACLKNLSFRICKKEKYGMGSLLYLKDYLFISYFKFAGKQKRGIPYFAIYDLKNKKTLKNQKGLFYILYHSSGDKIYLSDEDNDKVLVFKVE